MLARLKTKRWLLAPLLSWFAAACSYFAGSADDVRFWLGMAFAFSMAYVPSRFFQPPAKR